MPKNGFPIPTAKNGFHILDLHPKKHVFQKIPFFNGNLLEKFQIISQILIFFKGATARNGFQVLVLRPKIHSLKNKHIFLDCHLP